MLHSGKAIAGKDAQGDVAPRSSGQTSQAAAKRKPKTHAGFGHERQKVSPIAHYGVIATFSTPSRWLANRS